MPNQGGEQQAIRWPPLQVMTMFMEERGFPGFKHTPIPKNYNVSCTFIRKNNYIETVSRCLRTFLKSLDPLFRRGPRPNEIKTRLIFMSCVLLILYLCPRRGARMSAAQPVQSDSSNRDRKRAEASRRICFKLFFRTHKKPEENKSTVNIPVDKLCNYYTLGSKFVFNRQFDLIKPRAVGRCFRSQSNAPTAYY